MFEYKVTVNGLPVKITRYREDVRAWYRQHDAGYQGEGVKVHYYQKRGYMATWEELDGGDL